MENFLNRTDEKAIFDKLYKREKTFFSIVYGRRRIGKSSLLRHVIDQKSIYWLSDMTEKTIQIKGLAASIASILPDFDKVNYPSWEVLFQALENGLREKITLVLDEFPYLVSSSPELPSIIQKIVDLDKKKMYNLVLCGSSQQMMRELFLGTTSPLYGRADAILNITSMKPAWLMQYLQCTAIETVKEYTIWGGVPRYWEIRRSYPTLSEALRYAVFDKNGILLEEPNRLFLDDMRSATQAYSIVNLVGNGNHRISEIANKLEKPATHFSRPMANLIEMGYLAKDIPFGESEKDSKKGLYRIADPFMNFYMQLVSGNKSMVEFGLWQTIKRQIDIKLQHLYASMWEQLVRTAIPYLAVANTNWSKGYRYWGKPDKKNEIEVDVLAESTDKKALLIAEVKWSNKVNLSEIEKSINQKLDILGISSRYEYVVKAVFVMDKSMIKPLNGIYLFDCEDIIPILK